MAAGTSKNDVVKGYDTTGNGKLDTHGPEYRLPEGKLYLEREDMAVIAESAGEHELAKQIREGKIEVTCFVQQYIEGRRQSTRC